jgi:hypothetical protein
LSIKTILVIVDKNSQISVKNSGAKTPFVHRKSFYEHKVVSGT